jgi:hypothetical protein
MPTTRSRITSTTQGAFDFISLKGQIAVTRQTVQEITRPGVDGHAYRLTGKRADPCELVGVRDFADYPSAQAGLESLRKCCGELVIVLDDFGNTYTDVMLLDVQVANRQPALSAVGGLTSPPTVDRALVTFRFRVQHTDTETVLT